MYPPGHTSLDEVWIRLVKKKEENKPQLLLREIWCPRHGFSPLLAGTSASALVEAATGGGAFRTAAAVFGKVSLGGGGFSLANGGGLTVTAAFETGAGGALCFASTARCFATSSFGRAGGLLMVASRSGMQGLESKALAVCPLAKHTSRTEHAQKQQYIRPS